MKAVVKNKIRYKVIKYPKGVGLHDDRTVPREGGTVGVSTYRFGDNWFVTSKGRALFKAYNVEKQGIRIVNELLYDELANQMDVRKSDTSYRLSDVYHVSFSSDQTVSIPYN